MPYYTHVHVMARVPQADSPERIYFILLFYLGRDYNFIKYIPECIPHDVLKRYGFHMLFCRFAHYRVLLSRAHVAEFSCEIYHILPTPDPSPPGEICHLQTILLVDHTTSVFM